MNICLTIDLGLIGYGEALALQQSLVTARKATLQSMGQSAAGDYDDASARDVLLLCEHPHVITLGRNGKMEHLRSPERVLQQKGVEFHVTNRGGDITYHGPGQIVGYPILNLAAIRRDVGWYVRMLEEIMIRTSADFGVSARREPGKTGVWVEAGAAGASGGSSNESGAGAGSTDADGGGVEVSSGNSIPMAAEKLGAIGVHLSRWITSHGLAYNVCTDLRYFNLIVPCGIAGRKATSLEKILGHAVELGDAKASLVRHFGEAFGRQMEPTSAEELFVKLQRFEQPAAIPA
jgi:lipoyl(octanoyl) transferase